MLILTAALVVFALPVAVVSVLELWSGRYGRHIATELSHDAQIGGSIRAMPWVTRSRISSVHSSQRSSTNIGSTLDWKPFGRGEHAPRTASRTLRLARVDTQFNEDAMFVDMRARDADMVVRTMGYGQSSSGGRGVCLLSSRRHSRAGVALAANPYREDFEMAGDALFLGWGPVVRGRELKALEVFQETLTYYDTLQRDGRIDSFEPVLIAPHGGEIAGFIVLRGSRASLDEIRSSDDFRRLVTRAAAVVDDVGVIDAYTGEALAQQMTVFQSTSEELAG